MTRTRIVACPRRLHPLSVHVLTNFLIIRHPLINPRITNAINRGHPPTPWNGLGFRAHPRALSNGRAPSPLFSSPGWQAGRRRGSPPLHPPPPPPPPPPPAPPAPPAAFGLGGSADPSRGWHAGPCPDQAEGYPCGLRDTHPGDRPPVFFFFFPVPSLRIPFAIHAPLIYQLSAGEA